MFIKKHLLEKFASMKAAVPEKVEWLKSTPEKLARTKLAAPLKPIKEWTAPEGVVPVKAAREKVTSMKYACSAKVAFSKLAPPKKVVL